METEDSIERTVSSPAPENVNKVDTPNREDQDTGTPTKKESVKDENEMERIADDTGEGIQEKVPDFRKEEKDLETATMNQFPNDELDETAGDTVIEGQEQVCDIRREDQEVEISSKNDEMEGTAINIVKEHQEVEMANGNHTPYSPTELVNSENSINSLTAELDIQKEDQVDNSTKKTTLNPTAEVDETSYLANDSLSSDQSSEKILVKNQSGKQLEVGMHQKEVQVEAPLQMTSQDVSSSDPEVGDDVNDPQAHIETLVSEETGERKENLQDVLFKEEEPSCCGTEASDVQASGSSAWPEKADGLSNFTWAKSMVAVTSVFRRLSGQSVEGSNAVDAEDKDINVNGNNIKEVNLSNKSDVQEVGQTTVDKPSWNSALRLIGITHDSYGENKADFKEPIDSLQHIAMKGRIILYTRLGCQECKEARLFLKKKRLEYAEINIDLYPSRKVELEKISRSSAVPRVCFNEVLVGGLNDLKHLDESGELEGKIEYVITEAPSSGAPLPPLSGEDDVPSVGSIDELAIIVRKMKVSIVVKDRFHKFRIVSNCFVGSEAIDFLSEDQYLERQEAIEFGRKLAQQLFFQHVFNENTFEDGNHLYRFLDQDPVIAQCHNIPRGIVQLKPKPLAEISWKLGFLLYAILEAYTLEDGKHLDYRTIHGSEEFARYLRITEELQRIDLSRTAKEERLAFFINLYNMMALHGILVWGYPKGPLDRRKLLGEFKYVIGGCAYSLSDIHNGILRGNQRPPYSLIKPFGVTDKRFKVALPYPEPLVHFALVCGNRSDPALRVYSPKNIDAELVEAARGFLRRGALVLDADNRTLSVSKILNWYSVDFGNNEVEVLKHAANYLEPEKSQTLLDLLDSTPLKVVYQPYDWQLNCYHSEIHIEKSTG